jgi:hypothetical protein
MTEIFRGEHNFLNLHHLCVLERIAIVGLINDCPKTQLYNTELFHCEFVNRKK